jgi:hypothetical protein
MALRIRALAGEPGRPEPPGMAIKPAPMASAKSALLDSRRGTPPKSAPLTVFSCEPVAPSGECGLANRNQQVIADGSNKHIILVLKPSKLSF